MHKKKTFRFESTPKTYQLTKNGRVMAAWPRPRISSQSARSSAYFQIAEDIRLFGPYENVAVYDDVFAAAEAEYQASRAAAQEKAAEPQVAGPETEASIMERLVTATIPGRRRSAHA